MFIKFPPGILQDNTGGFEDIWLKLKNSKLRTAVGDGGIEVVVTGDFTNRKHYQTARF